MKKTLILMLVSSLLASCNGNESAPAAPAPAPPTTTSTPAPAATTETATEATQEPKRIDMAKEGPSIVWEEKVAANSTNTFVFYAKKGQKLTLSFIDDTKVGSMDLGKFSVEPNTDPLKMPIEVSKDYRLSVSNNSDKATSFRISMSLE